MLKKIFIAIPLFLVLLLTDALAQQTITGRVLNENADPLSQDLCLEQRMPDIKSPDLDRHDWQGQGIARCGL